MKTFKCFDPRPADIPPGWLIFNAPRPLAGHRTGTGDFRHGIHYAAVDPTAPDAEQMKRRNTADDGWLVGYVTQANVDAWAVEFARENGYDLSDSTPEEIRQSYLVNHPPVELPN